MANLRMGMDPVGGLRQFRLTAVDRLTHAFLQFPNISHNKRLRVGMISGDGAIVEQGAPDSVFGPAASARTRAFVAEIGR